MGILINESADLFEAGPIRAGLSGEGDLVDDLGARIARLIDRHRSTRRAVDDLRAALLERDRRVIELDAKLAAFERVRAELMRRIDALVAQVDRLAEAGSEGAR
jgi:chromosome segregation ATPase